MFNVEFSFIALKELKMGGNSLEELMQEWMSRFKSHVETRGHDDTGEKSSQKPSWQQMEEASREEIANFVANFGGREENRGEKSQNTLGDTIPIWERTWKDDIEVRRAFSPFECCEKMCKIMDSSSFCLKMDQSPQRYVVSQSTFATLDPAPLFLF